ncbi:hypothetical protein GCM10027445_39240 [Amycolatopsis endophytica]
MEVGPRRLDRHDRLHQITLGDRQVRGRAALFRQLPQHRPGRFTQLRHDLTGEPQHADSQPDLAAVAPHQSPRGQRYEQPVDGGAARADRRGQLGNRGRVTVGVRHRLQQRQAAVEGQRAFGAHYSSSSASRSATGSSKLAEA